MFAITVFATVKKIGSGWHGCTANVETGAISLLIHLNFIHYEALCDNNHFQGPYL